MPLSPGRISPRSMDDRQWATFVSQAGIQANREVRTFAPSWVGFSVDPVGEISYEDFGSLVVLRNDGVTPLTGTSNTFEMQITNLPAAIRPTEYKLRECLVVNNDFTASGAVGIDPSGTLQFFFMQVTAIVGATEGLAPEAAGFNNANTKGLPVGWLVMYSK